MSNTVPDPDAITLADERRLLFDAFEEWSNEMQDTRVRPLQAPTTTRRRRGLVTVLGAAAVVVVAIVAGAAVLNRTDPAAANLATIEAYQQSLLAGDWAAIQAAYSPDATWEWVAPDPDAGNGAFAGRATTFPNIFPYFPPVTVL